MRNIFRMQKIKFFGSTIFSPEIAAGLFGSSNAMGHFVERETIGKVAILRLNSPDTLNAIATHEDCDDLIDAIRAIADDRSISVGILTGNGRAFCAGGNLKAMKDRSGIGPLDQPDSTRSNYRRGVQAVTRAMMDLEVPMIAAINGHAVGLG
jgi:2-(1,2-epoxy-1,2-dihydrophenyl)acetyl-CoA isomerase